MGKRRSLDDDPAFVELRERVARLETGVARLETDVKWLKDMLKKVDNRTWTILACVILGIVLTLATRLF
jgi:hypothetical protein